MFSPLHTRITASLLLALFLSFTAARGLFFHTHIEGKVLISHSHPFADATHHHSTAQLISIDSLCGAAMTDDSTRPITLTHHQWSTVIRQVEIPAVPLSGFLHILRDRAPPRV